MDDSTKFAFHDIDFLLPVHRFSIAFSYIAKRGFPFIREFLLRLVHLAPMQPEQIAQYFDMTAGELKEALGDLLDKGDIVYLEDGSVTLTAVAQGYFSSIGEAPTATRVEQTQSIFKFEIAGFNCLSDQKTKDDWRTGINIKIENEVQGLSGRYASQHFQKQFHTLLSQGYMPHIMPKDSDKLPVIYKMDSVKKIGQEPKRLELACYLDGHGKWIEATQLEAFENDEPILNLITETFSLRRSHNLMDVGRAMSEFEDDITHKFVSEEGIDVQGLVSTIQTSKDNDDVTQLFLGPIYSEGNWAQIIRLVTIALSDLQTKHQDGINNLIWLAPTDHYWAKSNKFSRTKTWLFEQAQTSGKKAKRLFYPKLYLPLVEKNDKRGKSDWERLLGSSDDYYGYIEGFFNGTTEVLVLEGQFAVVCYHLVIPEVSNLSMPIGFMTTDKRLVKQINQKVTAYLGSRKDVETPVDLGKF